MRRVVRLVLPMLAIAGSCGASPRGRFESDVAPELERRCLASVCHGVRPDAERFGEVIDWSRFMVRLTADGKIADTDAAYATIKARIDTRERGEFSTLLRKPLARQAGGVPHAGGVLYASRDHASYRTILDWIRSETGSGEGADRNTLAPLEQQFATNVLPLLASKQCTNAACHDPASPLTAFEPPPDIDGELVFSVAAVRKNYSAARKHLYLGGYAALSRLVRKMLPLEQGGMPHRGGNGLVRWGAASAAIEGWCSAERAAALGSAEPGVRGFVFVRGPVAAEDAFATRFTPGSDLFIADGLGGEPRNATASLHGAPADVRDPAVRHDAKRIVFAMRTSSAFDLWEIGVDGSDAKQLTSNVDAVQPVYGPDGRVYFVSNGDIAAVDPASGALERLTHDPSPESTPAFFAVGKPYGTLAMTVMRASKSIVLRMPLDRNFAFHADPELHVHHGITIPADMTYAARELPDGRMTFVALDRAGVSRAGALGILDRSFGPMTSGTPSLAAYQSALILLDRAAHYRHPVGLPDGRILVSVADASEPAAFRVAALTNEELPAPHVEKVEWIANDARDAEPIAVRPLEDDPAHPPAWDPSKSTGTFDYRHVETLEAILSHLEPSGPKPLRTDLAYARLVEARTNRILAEEPLLGGSLHLEVPARVPFRVQHPRCQSHGGGSATRSLHRNRARPSLSRRRRSAALSVALFQLPWVARRSGRRRQPRRSRSRDERVDHAGDTRGDGSTQAALPKPLGAPIAIDFAKDILPLAIRSCGGCHADFDAYDTLRKRVVPSHAIESPLLAACPRMPPLQPNERLAIVRWIDRGALP